MPVTQFQITKNTSRSTIKVAGIPIVLNQKYDINLQSLITIQNDYGYPSEPLDNFKYKILVDDVFSVNEGTVTVNIETDKTSFPETISLVKEIEVYSELLFSDVVLPNWFYDRIKIISLTGKGVWIKGNDVISVGDVYFYHELKNNLKFIAQDNVSENNYNIFEWSFGNINEIFNQINSLQIDTIPSTIIFPPEEIPEEDLEP